MSTEFDPEVPPGKASARPEGTEGGSEFKSEMPHSEVPQLPRPPWENAEPCGQRTGSRIAVCIFAGSYAAGASLKVFQSLEGLCYE